MYTLELTEEIKEDHPQFCSRVEKTMEKKTWFAHPMESWEKNTPTLTLTLTLAYNPNPHPSPNPNPNPITPTLVLTLTLTL